jgi:membrane glycosyltransferase
MSLSSVAPFVGHNAFIRWSALQEIATEEAGGRKQIWSECHVSEDFDCALRVLNAGYVVRWATYTKGAFKEGVSLSAEDEINRWQKVRFSPFFDQARTLTCSARCA